jgi:hypothetical protein
VSLDPCRANDRKGASPTPLQSFQLAIGKAVAAVEVHDFTSLGPKKKGTVDMTPPTGQGAWLTRQEAEDAQQRWGYKWGAEWNFWEDSGCVWAGHNV